MAAIPPTRSEAKAYIKLSKSYRSVSYFQQNENHISWVYMYNNWHAGELIEKQFLKYYDLPREVMYEEVLPYVVANPGAFNAIYKYITHFLQKKKEKIGKRERDTDCVGKCVCKYCCHCLCKHCREQEGLEHCTCCLGGKDLLASSCSIKCTCKCICNIEDIKFMYWTQVLNIYHRVKDFKQLDWESIEIMGGINKVLNDMIDRVPVDYFSGSESWDNYPKIQYAQYLFSDAEDWFTEEQNNKNQFCMF
jgi:hypothetical protein